MPINWEDIKKDIQNASAGTDAALASKISSLTRMTDKEINSLFPKASDKEKLANLMQIVKEASRDNTKTANLVNNINDLSETVIKLIAKYLL